MTIEKIHTILLQFEKEGYFIEDVLETSYYKDVPEEELSIYKCGFERIYPFVFDIKFELFQILDGVPEAQYIDNLKILLSLILDMRIEKFTFIKLKTQRGKNWKSREKINSKMNWRKHKESKGMKPIDTPDEIFDTNDFVRDFEYTGKLPLGYETDWYGEIRKELLYFIDDTRLSYSLPKNQKIIEDAVAKIYSKL